MTSAGRLAAVFSTAALLLSGCGGRAPATEIEQACLQSSRSPGAAACQCSAILAGQMLSASDRGQAVRIFRDPDLYNEIRARNRDSVFLTRYRAWAEASEQRCA